MSDRPTPDDYPEEMLCPSVDTCAICGDGECDGLGCIIHLDPNDERDQPTINLLHGWVRRGRIAMCAERYLAIQENRRDPGLWLGWADE